MFRLACRSFPRRPIRLSAPRSSIRSLSTAAPHEQTRSWKNSALRWGIAVAGIYYYNTSTAFAEGPPATLRPDLQEGTPSLTLESLSPSSRKRQTAEPSTPTSTTQIVADKSPATDDTQIPSAEELEQDAQSQGAFNEETGEINWDCPCLGGMAYGPCGPEFREAFSCFVFSKEEPKGMDCIENFKNMQNCFRKYPEIYAPELEDDEDDESVVVTDGTAQGVASSPEDAPGVVAAVDSMGSEQKRPVYTKKVSVDTASPERSAKEPSKSSSSEQATSEAAKSDDGESAPSKLLSTPKLNQPGSIDEAESELVPRAAHDATDTSTVHKSDK